MECQEPEIADVNALVPIKVPLVPIAVAATKVLSQRIEVCYIHIVIQVRITVLVKAID